MNMENFYLLIVVILFALAISDLIVGVANDAVNFLNSAIGAKVAPRYIILIIASIGIVIGTTFSGGMMEVAQKGIFYPGQFAFSEIMLIFLAVMITDVILLDVFNSLGLPTSTTVSLVFELLGAAVSVAIIKINTLGIQMSELSNYINSANALAIISGILVSVIVAFTFGTIVQYIARLAFSFNYEKTFKYFGAIWGGLSITAITYFIVIKGAKGSTLLSPEITDWIHNNTSLLILYSFIGWTIVLQILYWVTRFNILRIIVLVGTFALALAFAGNDLVNFVGAPVAGFKSFMTFSAQPGADPDSFMMTALEGKIKTDTIILLLAGIIMVFALWFSRKAKKVTETEVSLGRQSVGNERFGSSLLSRSIVRMAMDFGNGVNRVIPKPVKRWMNKRFDDTAYQKKIKNQKDAPSFDLIRASVNLTVASVLIALGTSLKLPLSTTYVTFMVAMGSSLADNAWGRESAVYRVTGVITVIGGWFFTAFVAFTSAFLLALLISKGGTIAIIGLIILALFLALRTHLVFLKREKARSKIKKLEDEDLNVDDIHQKCSLEVRNMLKSVIQVFNDTIIGLTNEDRKILKKVCKEVDELNVDSKNMKANVHHTLLKLQTTEKEIETGPYYVQVIDYLREMAHALTFISNPSYEHIDNNHKGLNPDQVKELNEIKTDISDLFGIIIETIEKNKFENIPDLIEKQQIILDKLTECRKKQVKRIKNQESGTKISILYLGILNEIKNFLLQSINLVKAQRDFNDMQDIKD
jgi:hypothetical protein